MLQLKFATVLVMALAAGPASYAQERQPDCPVKPQPNLVYIVPPGDVYGPFIPYVPPKSCVTQNTQTASSNVPPPNSSLVLGPQPDSIAKPIASSPFGVAGPGKDLILAADAPAPAAPSPSATPAEGSTTEFVRDVPLHRAATIPQEIRPFHSIALGVTANTLGLGFVIATPMAHNLNLRSSYNIFAFNDPFSIDGVNYDARLHLKSSQTTVDWFAGSGFHVSPGVLYMKSTMSAPASVGAGQSFVLGTQTYINSVDNPVSGTSTVIYPRSFAPLLLIGYGNIIPRSGRHLSIPVEIGAAYTGSPQINVALNGTACTANGCVNFGGSTSAQTSVKNEINVLNEDLKRFPVFPIISVGFAYHF